MTGDDSRDEFLAEETRDALIAQLAVELWRVSKLGLDAFRQSLAERDAAIAADPSHPLHGEDRGAGSLAQLMWMQAKLTDAALSHAQSVLGDDDAPTAVVDRFLDAWMT